MSYLYQVPSVMSKVCHYLASLAVAVVFLSMVNCASTQQRIGEDKVKNVNSVEKNTQTMHREL